MSDPEKRVTALERVPSAPITGAQVIEDRVYRDDETWATAN